MASEQNFKNHTRYDPAFHFTLVPILVLNLVVCSVYYSRHFRSHGHIGPWSIVMAVALLWMAGLIREYSLKVQNRVIRLEEKTRLSALCSPGELAELESLTVMQYVALRFASNPELPELARRAVREKMEPKDIKAAVKSWRADDYRV